MCPMIRAETDCRQGCIRCIPCVAFHPSHALDDIDVLVYLLITHDKAICLKCTVLFVFCVLVPRRWHSNHSQAKALYGEIVSAQSYMLSGERADQPSNESEKDQMRARKVDALDLQRLRLVESSLASYTVEASANPKRTYDADVIS